MTPIAIAAVAACFWTFATTLCRAEMLRKRLDPRPDIPQPTYQGNWPMILCMDIAALAFAGWGLEMVNHPQAVGPAAAFCAAACAVASSAILISMIGHNMRQASRRRAGEARAEDADAVREAVAEIPPTIEAALPQVFRDLAAAPDPYRPDRHKH